MTRKDQTDGAGAVTGPVTGEHPAEWAWRIMAAWFARLEREGTLWQPGELEQRIADRVAARVREPAP